MSPPIAVPRSCFGCPSGPGEPALSMKSSPGHPKKSPSAHPKPSRVVGRCVESGFRAPFVYQRAVKDTQRLQERVQGRAEGETKGDEACKHPGDQVLMISVQVLGSQSSKKARSKTSTAPQNESIGLVSPGQQWNK